MRRGVTFVEALVALLLAVVAFGMMWTLYFSTARMGHMGDLAGAMQEAAIALQILQRDLTQAVQKPDPSVDCAVQIRRNGFQLLRAEFQPDGRISGKLVVFRREATPNGNFRLKRTFDGQDSRLPGLYRDVKFVQLRGAGGPYIRVTLRVATHDVKAADVAGKASEEAVVSALVRVMGPEAVGGSVFSFPFLDLLRNIPFLGNL